MLFLIPCCWLWCYEVSVLKNEGLTLPVPGMLLADKPLLLSLQGHLSRGKANASFLGWLVFKDSHKRVKCNLLTELSCSPCPMLLPSQSWLSPPSHQHHVFSHSFLSQTSDFYHQPKGHLASRSSFLLDQGYCSTTA